MKTCLQISAKGAGRGFVLLAVLVFIMLLSMVTVSLIFRAQSDETAVSATAGSEQAWDAAMSGVEEAMRVAASATPGSIDWQDDARLFRGRPVYLDGGEQWSFSVFTPAINDPQADNYFGLCDESSRVNLNNPGDADFGKLPGISTSLAAALRQFTGQSTNSLATDSSVVTESAPPTDPLTNGYAATPVDVSQITQVFSLADVPNHGPVSTFDELLLIPGMTRALLHGPPRSAPGQFTMMQTKSAAGPVLPPDDSKSKRDAGLDRYLTIYSRDFNRSIAGQQRCNINDTNDPLPSVDLPAGFSNYVAAVRGANMQLPHITDALEATAKITDSTGRETDVPSGITKENLGVLLDLFNVDKQPYHDGLINVNTASAAVLASLPGIDSALADSIVSTRSGISPERRATIAWLYQEGVVDADKFKAIAPYLTARSFQFHFNVIGYGMPSGRYRVVECVVDVGGSSPKVLYMRDITRLGLPIDLREKNIASPDSTTALDIRVRGEEGGHSHG